METELGSDIAENEDRVDARGMKLGSSPANSEVIVSIKKDDIEYNMNFEERGIALIFNHENFNICNLKRRDGTAADSKNLEKCFRNLGFKVHVHNDYKCEDLIGRVDEVAELDHSRYDCFVMCVLTHGDQGILYAKDTAYKPESLWMPFTADRCKTLAGKPKLFFLQACQGDRLDYGVKVTQVDSDQSYKIPVHADILLAYSTIPGFYSWRNTSKGSWFIQALCKELEENAYKYDFLSLLTFVNRRVATDFESYVPDNYIMHGKKQVPYVTFTLTRLMKFKPKAIQLNI